MSKFNGLMDAKYHPPRQWVLNTKLVYEDDHLTDSDMQALKEVGAPIDMRSGKVTAPAGLKTDMASVPRAAWLFIAPWELDKQNSLDSSDKACSPLPLLNMHLQSSSDKG